MFVRAALPVHNSPKINDEALLFPMVGRQSMQPGLLVELARCPELFCERHAFPIVPAYNFCCGFGIDG